MGRHPEIPGFTLFEFSYQGKTKPVYSMGSAQNPGILLMHELPGMVPECIDLARRLSDEGFQVWMPLLVGKPGKLDIAGNLARLCISREFNLLAKHKNSPVTEWLRALGRGLHYKTGGKGIGVIGQCLTGGFVLNLMADQHVLAPVASQPGLPGGFSKAALAAVGVSKHAFKLAADRSKRDDLSLMGLRFTKDPMCTRARFDTLSNAFGDRFSRIEIDSSKGNAWGYSRIAHSVLTLDYMHEEGSPTREAYEGVVGFMKTQLG